MFLKCTSRLENHNTYMFPTFNDSHLPLTAKTKAQCRIHSIQILQGKIVRRSASTVETPLGTARRAPSRNVNQSDAAQIMLLDHLAHDKPSGNLSYKLRSGRFNLAHLRLLRAHDGEQL